MKRKFDRSNSIRCIEYWIKRGFTEDQGKQKISELQKAANQKRKHKPCSEETKEKLSVANKKKHYINYWLSKYNEEGEKLFAEFKQQYKNRGKKTSLLLKAKNVSTKERTPRCKEFWIKKGYSLLEANQKVSEVQSTFSLKKCIEKHGEIEGKKLWQDRQDRWLESISKKLPLIREKQKANAHVGFYSEKNIGDSETLLFYLLLLENSGERVLKYGLTKHENVKKRWGVSRANFNYTVIESKRLPAIRAIELECKLRNLYRDKLKNNFYRLTEIIDINELENVKCLINEYTGSNND